MAIQHAAIDWRVACVVSVVPYANLREEASGLIRKAIPIWGWWAPESQVQALIDRATHEAGFGADAVDVEAAMRHIDAPVLVMGADWDWITPPEHARRLAAAGKRTELIMLPVTGHLGTLFDLRGSIQRASLRFFDRHLAER